MLVESIVRKTLGLKDHVLWVREEGTVWVAWTSSGNEAPCSGCGAGALWDRLRSVWRHVPLWGISVSSVQASQSEVLLAAFW
jgi:hypothetical protein